jgi:predicted flap endonuclease-1-like 5' DNA nuclease
VIIMRVVLGRLYGIQPELEARLKVLGIRDSDDLLRFCATPSSVANLARATGVEVHVIRQLVHRADLTRIRGIGETYTMLLEEAGVGSLKELATRCPEDLRAQFSAINRERQLVGRVPALAMVSGWVTKARRLPAIVLE